MSLLDNKKFNRKKRKAIKKAWHRKIDKLKNKVIEIHRKHAKFPCSNFKHVLLPTFESSQMVKKVNDWGSRRNIRSKVARSMLTWSFYKHKMHLKQSAKRHNTFVHDVNEAYTSKTCGLCGVINEKLGGNKTFKCSSCGYECDGDFNGARNVLLRFLATR